MLVVLPLLVILVTGILLQWKKQLSWIQPPEQRGTHQGADPTVSFAEILRAAQSARQAGIETWADVDRLDVRPEKGVVKLLSKNDGWEVQIDLATGAVLQVAQRRSDLIEALHDGSWFHESAKLWLFFPAALVTLVLYLTGLYLFYLPYKSKWKRGKQQRNGTPPVVGQRKARPAHHPDAGLKGTP